MATKKKKTSGGSMSLSLTAKILLGMGLGVVTGLALHMLGTDGWVDDYILNGVFKLGGKVFVASLKLLVVPLVLVSLVCGVSSLDDVAKLGRVGGKTLGLYLVTTAIAISTALFLAIVFQPGAGFNLSSDASFSAREAPPLIDVLINIVPTNPFQAMVEGNMLQVIVFAVLLGFALTRSGRAGSRLITIFNDANEVIMKLVMLLMEIAPYGVFFLIASVFAKQGSDAFEGLVRYFLVVVFALLIHVAVTYPVMLKTLSGLSPLQFFKKVRQAPLFAFSTASSNATLPITLETAEINLGVRNSIASFTIPLGATVNMDGTAIMQGVATVFIAQAYGIDIGMSGYLMVVVTATLASIGTAGVPGVGIIMLAMVLRQVNLPAEGIAYIIGVDRLLDMLRTAVNVTGDCAVSCVVAKSEGQFSEEVFQRDLT